MSIPTSNQRFIIDGDLQIATKPSSTGNTLGRIVFTDNTIGEIGSVKVYGFSQSTFRLINDASKIGRGISFRTFSSQGGFEEGGTGALYLMDVQNGYIRLGNYTTVSPLNHRYPTEDFPGVLLYVKKGAATTGSYALVNDCISQFSTRSLVSGQSETINVGLDSGYGTSLGYRAATIPYGFTGISLNSLHTIKECIKYFQNGNVEIPLRLDVGTINAATYLNLPPVPSSQLLPITLDSAQGRVGINQTTPAAALDVTGNVHFTGTLDASDIAVHNSVLVEGDATVVGTLDVRQDIDINRNLNVLGDATIFRLGVIDNVSAYRYFSGSSFLVGGTGDPEGNVEGTPASIYMRSDTGDVYTKTGLGTTGWTKVGSTPDLSPITLDKANSRVGINKAVPTTALDVGGAVSATGLVVSGGTTTSTLTLTTIPAKTTQTNVIYYDTSTKAVSYGTVPQGGDLLPITLDKVNNRVGINNATPGAPLHVTGNIRAGWIVDSVAIGNRAGWSGVAGEQQKTNAVAVGVDAGTKNQGIYGTAIGAGAGSTDQKSYGVAIGYEAGYGSQGEQATAVGKRSGKNSQGTYATSCGVEAGYESQGMYATAIGAFSGYDRQGTYAVAIGARAGLQSQHANSIIINGTADQLNSNGTSRFFVKPVRQDTAQTNYVLHYNPTTGEITYGA